MGRRKILILKYDFQNSKNLKFSKGQNLCVNINECLSAQLNHCYSGGICTDTEGSYTCDCPDGYVGDGRDCDNIDECQNGSHDCDPENGICLGRLSNLLRQKLNADWLIYLITGHIFESFYR